MDDARPKVEIIGPQPGSQEAFLASPADIVFYGGEAGSGKTAGLVLEGMRNHDVRGFGAIMFRRTSPQLEGPGSLWELICEWYPMLGARCTGGSPMRAVFPSSAVVLLDHLQHEGDRFKHQGKGYALICFDELPHFLESQFWYLYSRNRSTTGVPPYIRATMNPDPDSWVKKMILWYLDERGQFVRPERSGVVRFFYRVDDDLVWGDSIEELREKFPERTDAPTSFTFILGRLADNKILEQKDPGYRARLLALPRVERERLLGQGQGGDWLIRPAAGLYFQRGWFNVIDEPPDDIVVIVRAWDKAASQATPENPDPAWTRGVKMGITKQKRIVVLDVVSLRGSPHQVDAVMLRTAQGDGKSVRIGIWQDPGQAGVVDVAHTKEVLIGYWVDSEVAREDKITYAGPYSTQVEARNVDVLRAPWNDGYFSELQAFPDAKIKDQVDASSRAFRMLHSGAIVAYQAAMQAVQKEFGV